MVEEKNICSHHPNINGSRACVSLVPIFNHLTEEQMDEVMEVVRSVAFKKGEIIYRAGEAANSLYIIHHGQVKIYRLSESGKEQMIRILQPGDFTGEFALFKQSEHQAYAEALIDTQICFIRREDIQKLLSAYPAIALKILSEFSDRLEHAEKQATTIATEKVDTRIATFLVECIEDVEQEKAHIVLPMSRKDLASYLGTTPETVSRKLTEFEDAGFIKQNGQRNIQILDVDGLLLV